MNIESTTPGMVWNFYLSTFSTPKAIVAIEVKIEGQFIVQEWNARSARSVLLGRATAKNKNDACTALLSKMLSLAYISKETFDSAQKIFS